MDIQSIIKEKIKLIEGKTGDKVIIETEIPEEYQRHSAFVDFPSWTRNGRIGLPILFIRENIDEVHKLHELIHLEKFFIEKYPIVFSPSALRGRIDVFKNIPEDYVAHKIINDICKVNPIALNFLDRDNVNDGRSDKQIAADLVQYHFFSEFDKEYRKRLESFRKNCSRQRHQAYSIAQEAIKCVSAINCNSRSSYEEGLKELLNIFESDESQIQLEFYKKNNGAWKSVRI